MSSGNLAIALAVPLSRYGCSMASIWRQDLGRRFLPGGAFRLILGPLLAAVASGKSSRGKSGVKNAWSR